MLYSQKRSKLKEELGLGDNWGDSSDDDQGEGAGASSLTEVADSCFPLLLWKQGIVHSSFAQHAADLLSWLKVRGGCGKPHWPL